MNDAIVEAASKYSRLDGLVCTPAINVRKPILKYSGDEFDRVVQVNLRGNFNVLRSAGWLMVPQGFGSIVLFSSIRSIVTEPGQSVYSMTKAGILQLVKTAATEWGTTRRSGQRGRPGRDRNAADRADQTESRVVQRLRDEEPDEPVGAGLRDGGADSISLVGRRKLCDWDDLVCRWRLAGR